MFLRNPCDCTEKKSTSALECVVLLFPTFLLSCVCVEGGQWFCFYSFFCGHIVLKRGLCVCLPFGVCLYFTMFLFWSKCFQVKTIVVKVRNHWWVYIYLVYTFYSQNDRFVLHVHAIVNTHTHRGPVLLSKIWLKNRPQHCQLREKQHTKTSPFYKNLRWPCLLTGKDFIYMNRKKLSAIKPLNKTYIYKI